jgi:hypothetical protein
MYSLSLVVSGFTIASNVLHNEHVADFGALHNQTIPKLDTRLKAK